MSREVETSLFISKSAVIPQWRDTLVGMTKG
jgi:hypothetical protein